MPKQYKEANLILAIQAMKNDPKLSRRLAASIYEVPEASLRRQMNGQHARCDIRNGMRKLTSAEEEALVRYIFDLDSRGFPPRYSDVRDMANLLLATRQKPPVGKNYPHNFVQGHPELKTRFSRSYDFQRALCEDPATIEAWFRLVANMWSKYGIQDTD